MYANLRELQAENEISIERHLETKARAYKLRQTLTDTLL